MTSHKTIYHSFCKINLGLEVLRKREDGYHDINTVFYRLQTPKDTIIVGPNNVFELVVNDSSIPADNSNLITKAFKQCAVFMNVELPPVRIELQKKVPHGAGLGGGSANAAKSIEIFSQVTTPLTAENQYRIAASLGADVPFFLMHDQAGVASAKGDIITPVSFELPFSVVIVKPRDISISTDEAYKNLRLQVRAQTTDLLPILRSPIKNWRDRITNDFEQGAFEKYPELKELKQRLYDSGADFVLMSGSGSAFFAIYDNREVAKEATMIYLNDDSLEVFVG